MGTLVILSVAMAPSSWEHSEAGVDEICRSRRNLQEYEHGDTRHPRMDMAPKSGAELESISPNAIMEPARSMILLLAKQFYKFGLSTVGSIIVSLGIPTGRERGTQLNSSI